MTSMGFYGTTNYDSGLPTMPRQTILENTRATRPWHIGAHETLSRLGVLPPYPKKKNTKRKGQQSGVVFFLSKINKPQATSLKLQATSYKLQAASGAGGPAGGKLLYVVVNLILDTRCSTQEPRIGGGGGGCVSEQASELAKSKIYIPALHP